MSTMSPLSSSMRASSTPAGNRPPPLFRTSSTYLQSRLESQDDNDTRGEHWCPALVTRSPSAPPSPRPPNPFCPLPRPRSLAPTPTLCHVDFSRKATMTSPSVLPNCLFFHFWAICHITHCTTTYPQGRVHYIPLLILLLHKYASQC